MYRKRAISRLIVLKRTAIFKAFKLIYLKADIVPTKRLCYKENGVAIISIVQVLFLFFLITGICCFRINIISFFFYVLLYKKGAFFFRQNTFIIFY